MDIIFRVIDGEVWRKASKEETRLILGAPKQQGTATRKGRTFSKAERDAQSKRMKAYWAAKRK